MARTRRQKFMLLGGTIGGIALLATLTTSPEAWAQGMMKTLLVQVTNPAADPVLVRDVDNAVYQPFSAFLSCAIDPGDTFCADSMADFVPPGELLVVETITAEANGPVGQVVLLNAFKGNSSGSNVHAFLSLVPQAGTASGNTFYRSVTTGARLYFEAGTSFGLTLARQGVTDDAGLSAVVTGFMVNCGPGPGCAIP